MNETDSHDAETATVDAAADAAVAPAQAERPTVGIDLANRPKTEWLDTVQSELNDTDLVLKCLARDSAKMCETCNGAEAKGELDARPMLARCASTKLPR